MVGVHALLLDVTKSAGDFVLLAVAISAAVNDGVVSSMAFLLALSRTLYATAEDGYLPDVFKFYAPRRGPIYSVLLSTAVLGAVVFGGLFAAGNAFSAFEIAGLLSMLGNVFVHIVANFSLFRISLKRMRKRAWQLALSAAATAFSLYVMASTLAAASPSVVYAFFAWLLLGFFAVEIIKIAKGSEEE